MTTTAQPSPLTAPSVSLKQQFTASWTRENATTRRVITALPDTQGDYSPGDGCRSFRDTAFIFVKTQLNIAAALNNEWTMPPQFPAMPSTDAEVLAMFDESTLAVKQALENAAESRLAESVTFFTGPKQMGEVPVAQLIWFMLLDSIHHRGQLTVYLRLAGAKVPSIYGPSKDEPWN